jgi:hypothetical protein
VRVRGIFAALALAGGAAWAETGPISAIDWLSDSVQTPLPVALPPPAGSGTPTPGEPATARSAGVEDVTVSTLGTVSPDAAGLLPASVSGLPRDLWGPTAAADLARLIRAERADMVPALQALLMRLLLAELDPPFDSDARGTLLLARVDKLLDQGALDQAAALIDRAGATATPEVFRRAFDIALLTHREDRACAQMISSPALSPTYTARIFCLARGGDWDTAALTLGTARALGYVNDAEDALLSRFLDPELYEGEPPPRLPGPVTPLAFRMLEAIGEAQPTGPLPRAFAQADLLDTAGWKAQIEAAERLTRSGALDPARLQGLYAARRPAASGGVWDRVAAVQALEAALDRRDAAAVATALPQAWARMAEVDLEPALAAMVGPRTKALALDGEAGRLAFRLALLGPGYEAAALARTPADATEAFLAGLARGAPPPSDDPMAGAVADGFAATGAPTRAQTLLSEKRTGEAILRALDLLTLGATGELDELSDGIALLRALGLEDTARRAALEILVLDRRG